MFDINNYSEEEMNQIKMDAQIIFFAREIAKESSRILLANDYIATLSINEINKLSHLFDKWQKKDFSVREVRTDKNIKGGMSNGSSS